MWLQGALGLKPSSWIQPQSTQPLAWRTSGHALCFASSVLVLHCAPGVEEWTKGEVEQLAALWELLPVRWLLFHVLQAWSCARPWTVNQVKSKSCLTLWLIVNMPSDTSAQELDSDAGAGTGEPASFRRDSLFSPLFPFPPHPSPLQPFPLLPRFPLPSHPLLYPPLGIGLRLIQFGRGEPL